MSLRTTPKCYIHVGVILSRVMTKIEERKEAEGI